MNRYQDIPITKNDDGVRYYKSVRYPQIPKSENDIYVFTTSGDRFDLLAQQYYKDSTLWWVISIANEELLQNSLYIMEGTQLRIPSNLGEILSKFKSMNS